MAGIASAWNSRLPHTITFRGMRGLSGAKRSANRGRVNVNLTRASNHHKVEGIHQESGEGRPMAIADKFSVATRRSFGRFQRQAKLKHWRN